MSLRDEGNGYSKEAFVYIAGFHQDSDSAGTSCLYSVYWTMVVGFFRVSCEERPVVDRQVAPKGGALSVLFSCRMGGN